MKEIVFRKTLILSAIGLLCLIFGTVYGVVSKDRVLIIMSVAICVVNLYKIVEIRKIENENKYIVISGRCIDGSYKFVGKYRMYKILTGDNTIEISVPKTVKLKLNGIYSLYFKKSEREPEIYGDWLKNKVLSENFLGYENINTEK